jgi:hypothetical protein
VQDVRPHHVVAYEVWADFNRCLTSCLKNAEIENITSILRTCRCRKIRPNAFEPVEFAVRDCDTLDLSPQLKSYTDGGFGRHNNPSEKALSEIRDCFSEQRDPKVHMFVSIGTGESNPRLYFYPSVYNLLKLIKYLTGRVTNTDEVHQAILEKYLNDQPPFPKRCSRPEHRHYYRFMSKALFSAPWASMPSKDQAYSAPWCQCSAGLPDKSALPFNHLLTRLSSRGAKYCELFAKKR